MRYTETIARVRACIESMEGRIALGDAVRRATEANRRADEMRAHGPRDLDVPFDAPLRVHGR